MAEYNFVTTIANTWVKAASGVQSIQLWRQKTTVNYLYAFVKEGDPAPVGIDQGVPIFRLMKRDSATFQYSGPTDVYIYSRKAGLIRADVGAGDGAASAPNPNPKIPSDNFFIQENGPATSLVVPAVLDGKQIQVTDPSDFSIGDVVVITNPASIYFGEALAVVGDIITLDSLLPFAYPVAITVVQSYTKDMNVDGSVTPQVFSIFGPGAPGIKLNVVRFVWDMLTATAVDLSKFGDIVGGVTNGMLLRGVPNPSSGLPASNQFNLKTNADFNTISGGDWKPYDAQNVVQGQHGCNTRYTMGGEEKHDAIAILITGDRIDIILTDDFSTLLQWRTLFGGNTEFVQ